MLCKNILLTIYFSLISSLLFSQKKTDINFLFKTWAFIEKRNINIDDLNDFPEKDSSLFTLFFSSLKLKVDTLWKSSFPDDYLFFAILPQEANKHPTNVSDTNNSLSADHIWYTSIPINCKNYILCVNIKNGISYRLGGFHGNDFMIFLEDIKTRFYHDHFQKLTTSNFLKNFKVQGIDFGCLNSGLKANGYNKNLYPCLNSCEDNVTVFPSK